MAFVIQTGHQLARPVRVGVPDEDRPAGGVGGRVAVAAISAGVELLLPGAELELEGPAGVAEDAAAVAVAVDPVAPRVGLAPEHGGEALAVERTIGGESGARELGERGDDVRDVS